MANNENLKKKPVKICDGDYVLRASKDKLQIILELHDADDFAVDDYVGGVITEAKRLGVVHGLVKEMGPVKHGKVVIAQGTPVQHGDKAKIKPIVRPAIINDEDDQKSTKSQVKNLEKVDFRELNNIVNVPEKQLLLQKVPATPGTPGKTVFGDEITAKPGKDVAIKCGPGVTLSDDGLQVHSQMQGKFVMENGKPAVYEEHTINSDVDMSVGNITFCGKRLVITGAVGPGFKIKCMGDIEIAKGVNAAHIKAGGNLKITGGLIGEDCSIKAWGDLDVDFCENTGPIVVRGSATIHDFAVQANMHIEKDLLAREGKGAIIGGNYVLGGSMYVQELGSDAEVLTEVTTGLNPHLESRKGKIEAARELVSPKLNETLKDISSLSAMQKKEGKDFPPDKVALLKKLNAMMPKLMDKSNELTVMEEKLEEEILQAATESVYVYKIVYPGVSVTIGKASRVLNSEETKVVIELDKTTQKIHARAMTPEESSAAPA